MPLKYSRDILCAVFGKIAAYKKAIPSAAFEISGRLNDKVFKIAARGVAYVSPIVNKGARKDRCSTCDFKRPVIYDICAIKGARAAAYAECSVICIIKSSNI